MNFNLLLLNPLAKARGYSRGGGRGRMEVSFI